MPEPRARLFGSVGVLVAAAAFAACSSSGDVGPAGGVGPSGATGPAGLSGSSGASGAPGATGALGTPGATGASGTVGATGPTGPGGDSGSLGPTGPTAGVTLRVSPTGTDFGDGSASAPFASLGAALTRAATFAPVHVDVLIAGGTYAIMSPVTVATDASLLGGYAGGDWSTRDPGLHAVTLSGTASPLVDVTAPSGDVVVDGLALVQLGNGSTNSIPFYCLRAIGSPTISNNTCTMSNLTANDNGYGIEYPDVGQPVIVGNTIRVSGGAYLVGIGYDWLPGAGGTIARNDIRVDGSKVYFAFGIDIVVGSAGVTIDSNVVDVGASATYYGNGGIAFTGAGPATITNNTVRFGFPTATNYQAFGIGDLTDNDTNQTVHTVAYTIENNLVWSGLNTELSTCIVLAAQSSFTKLANNDLFDCATGFVNMGLENGTLGAETTTIADVNALANASANVAFSLIGGTPNAFFVNDASDWRLQTGQLTLAGFATVKEGGLVLVGAGASDGDGDARPKGTVGTTGWSIGAYQQSY